MSNNVTNQPSLPRSVPGLAGKFLSQEIPQFQANWEGQSLCDRDQQHSDPGLTSNLLNQKLYLIRSAGVSYAPSRLKSRNKSCEST